MRMAENDQAVLVGKRWISEKDGVQEDWYKKAADMKIDQLDQFVNDLMTKYSHDQMTVCHAMVAGALATIASMNSMPEGQVGAEQAKTILGLFIRKWARIDGPVKLVSWYGLLHPGNEYGFNTIPDFVWKDVVGQAKEMLVADDIASVDLKTREHLEMVASGKPPFGMRVQGESK